MEFAGIITEYDPFHNGHAAQLAAVRRAGARRIAVCLSSGAVQRGGAPILPKRRTPRSCCMRPACCKARRCSRWCAKTWPPA